MAQPSKALATHTVATRTVLADRPGNPNHAGQRVRRIP